MSLYEKGVSSGKIRLPRSWKETESGESRFQQLYDIAQESARASKDKSSAINSSHEMNLTEDLDSVDSHGSKRVKHRKLNITLSVLAGVTLIVGLTLGARFLKHFCHRRANAQQKPNANEFEQVDLATVVTHPNFTEADPTAGVRDVDKEYAKVMETTVDTVISA